MSEIQAPPALSYTTENIGDLVRDLQIWVTHTAEVLAGSVRQAPGGNLGRGLATVASE
jgi:hypothetical protein